MSLNWNGPDNFAEALNEGEIQSTRDMGEALGNLDRVRTVRVAIANGEVWDPEPGQNFKAIQSLVSGKVYSVPTRRYTPVQDEQIFRPLYEFFRKSGMDVVGTIKGVGKGRTTGYFFPRGEEFQVPLSEEYEIDGEKDMVDLGIRVWNSYNKESSVGGDAAGIRWACSNGMSLGRVLARFTTRHTGSQDELALRFEFLLYQMLRGVDKLQDKVKVMIEEPLTIGEAENLLWGIRLPLGGIDEIVAKPSRFTPEITTLGINAYTIYNAATAYISHRENGGKHFEASERHMENASKIFHQKVDDLIKEGDKRKNEWIEKQRERERQRSRVKATSQVRL